MIKLKEWSLTAQSTAFKNLFLLQSLSCLESTLLANLQLTNQSVNLNGD